MEKHQKTVPWLPLLHPFLRETLCFSINSSECDATWMFLHKWFSPGARSTAVSQLHWKAADRRASSPSLPLWISFTQCSQLWTQGWAHHDLHSLNTSFLGRNTEPNKPERQGGPVYSKPQRQLSIAYFSNINFIPGCFVNYLYWTCKTLFFF